MNPNRPAPSDDPDQPAGDAALPDEGDLWFLAGPEEDEPGDPLAPATAQPLESPILADWARAEAGCAARLARVAWRLGALDERLRRGPEGWLHRLALIEAADLSWFAGDRVGPDRLALWMSLRLSGAGDDSAALARVGWAARRLTGGPGPQADLAAFLDRRDPEAVAADTEPFADRAGAWLNLMAAAQGLHPVTRACMGFHLWSLAGMSQQGDRMEAAVTAARIAAAEAKGLIFAPLAMGGTSALRAGGKPDERLLRWLDGMETACQTAMRQLDDVEGWSARAAAAMAGLSGRTPPALRKALADWPLISAPMAEALSGASRAAVQRNLAWMEKRGLIREVTGQGRFRMWRIAI